ncbi:MAG TPA: C4-type zinc ribbon domain-containing protein [Blastocatellia bacterium]|nr:C4-type zinc ribbon domain-containing protein [Blastocatellia bacterium]
MELQELDLEIQRISDRLARIPAERDQIENEFKQYAAEFLDLKSKHEQIIEDRKQLEAELATVQQNHEKYKQDLMRVRNQKEYETALREIDATKKHASALESEILKRMEELEKLDAELAARAPDAERKRAETDEILASLDNEQQQADGRLTELKEQRERLAERMPAHLMSAYDRMSRRGRGQALSEVNAFGVCTACRMKVRPKVFSDVRRGDQLITCEHCGRILYYRSEPSQSAETT